ncbi:hypothetical protein NQ315_000666, partial [Exocentrus adspersus]
HYRTGSVAYEKQTTTKTVLNEENALAISLAIVENPRISVRDISRDLGIKNGHKTKLQKMKIFLKFVLFSDECTFHRNGFVNRHNFHYYDTQNPHVVEVNHYQHNNWSLNVWDGIVHNFVIGPHIFEGRVTGQVFLNFLINDFPRLIHHLPDYIKNQMWLQLDGAPPHFSANVRQHLTENFPGQWIGRQDISRYTRKAVKYIYSEDNHIPVMYRVIDLTGEMSFFSKTAGRN